MSASCAWAQITSPISVSGTLRIKTALSEKGRAFYDSSIFVDEDNSSRTVTLSATVFSPVQKTPAGAMARQNALGFEVRNRLLIRAQTVAFQMDVPPQFQRAGELLRMLAASQARSGADGDHKTAFSARDVERIMSFVSLRGLSIEDANENGGKPLVLSHEQLRRDLKRTGSSAFDSFAFAGGRMRLQVGVPVSSRATSKGVTIGMPSGFWFIWEREGAARKLFLRKLISQSRST